MRIGGFHNPHREVPTPVAEARAGFFYLVSRLEPNTIRTLRSDVSPWYAITLHSSPPKDAQAELGDRLKVWSRKWYLTDEWCQKIALDTLHFWATTPNLLPNRFVVAREPTIEDLPEFRFRAAWPRREVSEEEFREWVKRRFKRKLDAFIVRTKREAEALGLVEAPKKKEFGKKLEMLVRWQCSHWELRRIADEYGYGTQLRGEAYHTGISGVSKALRESAKDIGLTLRRGDTGPPPLAADAVPD